MSLIFTLLWTSISFTKEVEIKTFPEGADVFIKTSLKDRGQKLGVTPFETKRPQFNQYSGSEKYFYLEVTKEGYQTFLLRMTKLDDDDFSLNINLDELPKNALIKKHDLLISQLFEVQRLIRSRNFAGAITQLDLLEEKFPYFSIISELKGITHYMNKDIQASLSMFRTAFSKNTDNQDAYKMKVYLEKKLGVSVNDK